jgi:large subunit ribosomal protein L17
MRHQKKSKRLSRQKAHRKAVLNNLVRSLVQKERITTTLLLAKESRRLADKLISLGKRNTLSARRASFRVLGDGSPCVISCAG